MQRYTLQGCEIPRVSFRKLSLKPILWNSEVEVTVVFRAFPWIAKSPDFTPKSGDFAIQGKAKVLVFIICTTKIGKK